MTPALQLGPFLLGDLLGQGGMARVFAARHQADGTPVAIKVVAESVRSDPAMLEAFHHEIGAVARLDHPGIVTVYDHGTVRADESAASAFAPGTPWLAMELVDGFSAGRLRGDAPWPVLRGLLLTVLDALAHAHARGVVHRDIKPANLLVQRASGKVQVADFGLAHSLRGPNEGPLGGVFVGTPSYCAPEQILIRAHEFGAWTDLYALGGTAWALACGSPPFTGSAQARLVAHLEDPLPTFEPVHPVPSGFERWLQGLLAKEPEDRFRHAADAAWALVRLGEPQDTVGTLSTIALPSTGESSGVSWWRRSLVGRRRRHRVSAVAEAGQPPMPTDWRTRRTGRRHLHGAGLALFGQRAVGIVGREGHRERLWRALRTARDEARPQLVLLEGPAGAGKSALAAWLCARAEEVGVAQALRATHTAGAGPDDGLGPAFARHFRVDDLDPDGVEERVHGALRRLGENDRGEARALAEAAAPSDLGGVTLHGPEERHRVFARARARLAGERPVLLWLDDLPHGPESQAFVAWLLDQPADMRVLVVATARAEALAEVEDADDAWAALASHERAARIVLPPLSSDEQNALLRELLGVAPGLAAEVEARAEGSPLFAVQLVGDWVQRGLLVPGELGFELAPGVEPGFPQGLIGVWDDRIGELLARRSEAERDALELAAVGGRAVRGGEWAAVCEAAGVAVPVPLVDALVRLRLAVPAQTPGSWSFVHGMLRDALVSRADDGGRRSRWASLWADVLAGVPAARERRARHLIDAGRFDEAPDVLLEVVDAVLGTTAWGRGQRLLRLLSLALDRTGADADDPRQVMADFAEARMRLVLADHPGARAYAESAMARARTLDAPPLLLEGLQVMGKVAITSGLGEDAVRYQTEAEALAERLGDEEAVILAAKNRAFSLTRLGQGAEAIPHAERAERRAVAAGEHNLANQARWMLSKALRLEGDDARGEELVLEAHRGFLQHGHRWLAATTAIEIGDLRRRAGDLDGAEAAYRESAALYEATAERGAALARLNQGITAGERGRHADAVVLIEAARHELERSGRVTLVAAAWGVLLDPLSELGRWQAFEEALDTAESMLADRPVVEQDIAVAVSRAARRCADAERPLLAERASAIARSQWTALGRLDQVLALGG